MPRCVRALGEEDVLEHLLSNSGDDVWLFESTNQQDMRKVLITIRAIWWARRRAIHENEFQSPLSTMCFINRYFEDLDIASSRSTQTNVQTAQSRVQRWIALGESAVKINVDIGLSR